MPDAQTPQQTLDIATATTRQAHKAAKLPGWVAVATGTSAGLGIMLMIMAGDYDMLGVFGWIAGITLLSAYAALAVWLRRAQRARGVVPTSSSWWKHELVGLMSIWVMPTLGHAFPAVYLPMSVLCGAIMGVWVWYEVARPRIALWKH